MQALCTRGMGPKFLAYVDKRGRPIWCVAIQLAFGLLAYVTLAGNSGFEFFYWLLALSGIANFFIWGSICLSHIRFRQGWLYTGRTLDELPYRAQAGVIGSYCGLFLACICLVASFYVAVWPVGGSPDPYYFFQQYLAAPLILVLYLFWKVFTKDWKMLVPLSEMDVVSGMRVNIRELQEMADQRRKEHTLASLPLRIARALF